MIKKFVVAVMLFACGFPGFSQEQMPGREMLATIDVGFNIPELYNLGLEINSGYYVYTIDWFRVAPGVQISYFVNTKNDWFDNTDISKNYYGEYRLNIMANMEFLPFKRSSFFIGVVPYLGCQLIQNKGKLINHEAQLDFKYNYQYTSFDFGLRLKAGGFFGEKQRHGMHGYFQFSMRGIADRNPYTKFFNLGMSDYKSYIGLGYIYRIR